MAALRRLAQPAEAADMGLRLSHHHFDDWRQATSQLGPYMTRIDSQMASLVWEYESLDVPAARVPLRVPKH